MTKPFLEKEKSAIIASVCNLPSAFWRAGYYEIMTGFIERMGNRYASERVEAYRQHKLFTEEELQMFFDIEVFFLEFLEKDYPFWLCFTCDELERIKALRRRVLAHFNTPEQVEVLEQHGFKIFDGHVE
jgi:hypothetical protein